MSEKPQKEFETRAISVYCDICRRYLPFSIYVPKDITQAEIEEWKDILLKYHKRTEH